MEKLQQSPLFGAAILKLNFMLKRMTYDPGFRFVYLGLLKENSVTDPEVSQFIELHKDALLTHIKNHGKHT